MDTRLLTWENMSEVANWCGAADIYDTRYFLLIGEQIAQVGDFVNGHADGSFSVNRVSFNKA